MLLFAAFLGWRFMGEPELAEWKKLPTAQGATNAGLNGGKPAWLDSRGAGRGAERDEINPEDPDPRVQLALWKKRLDRSQELLDNYRKVTRYPHESRPADEHGDQMYPNQPVVEDKRLYKPGDELKGNIRLRTSQERVFVAGSESVLFTITAYDEQGSVVPLSIISAGVVDPPQGSKPSALKRMGAGFNDAGFEGDTLAGDGTHSFRLTPATQGFANYTGQLRLDMTIEAGGQSGFTYFDIFYTPEPPAIWTGAIREAVEAGSLNVYLKVKVRRPGRYVATGRFDDFAGKPFALAVFNEELSVGDHEIRFRAFGKLILDNLPLLPLRLRDVDGFLLQEDAFPDRALVPRLPGLVHMTKKYSLDVFSDAEWQSEERERYLREYLNDVKLAQARIDELTRGILPAPIVPVAPVAPKSGN